VASLGLSKYPWYAHLGVFVLVAAIGAGAFYYWVEVPRQEAMASRTRELDAILARNSKGSETARQLPESWSATSPRPRNWRPPIRTCARIRSISWESSSASSPAT
jgi:hypothetical protein